VWCQRKAGDGEVMAAAICSRRQEARGGERRRSERLWTQWRVAEAVAVAPFIGPKRRRRGGEIVR
jgi:hypothetical protein